MFAYIIIYSHFCQNTCGVKSPCRRFAPLAGRRPAPLGFFDQEVSSSKRAYYHPQLMLLICLQVNYSDTSLVATLYR